MDDGFDQHPVTGVSWYGAAKFCNWMTLIQNMPPSALAYVEGPDPSDWRAALSGASAMIALPGFRLPMDGGVGPERKSPREERFELDRPSSSARPYSSHSDP